MKIDNREEQMPCPVTGFDCLSCDDAATCRLAKKMKRPSELERARAIPGDVNNG